MALNLEWDPALYNERMVKRLLREAKRHTLPLSRSRRLICGIAQALANAQAIDGKITARHNLIQLLCTTRRLWPTVELACEHAGLRTERRGGSLFIMSQHDET